MPISSLRTKLISFFLLAMLLFSGDLAAAQSPDAVVMQAEPAFQGYFKYGEWLPVWVSLENNGPNLEGEIQVTVQQDFNQITYAVPVSLANGARKRLPVYALPNNFTRDLKVTLVSGDQVLQSQTVRVQPQPNITYLIGVAARERGALSLIPGVRLPGGRNSVLLDVALETLPARAEALRSLNLLILNDVDSSTLTPEQASAIKAWVQQGGRLVIGGGAGALQTVAGLPADLLPLHPTALVDFESVDSLSAFGNTTDVRVPGPFAVAVGSQPSGNVLVQQDGTPLVLEQSVGEGFSNFVSLDLSGAPFNAWVGTTAFWQTLITPGADYPSWLPPDISVRQMASGPINNALSNIPSLDLPSAQSLVVLLVVYILLVGPANYLVLRWGKRLQWAWVTIPLITLVFTALSFGIGYAKRGTDLLVNKIAIITAQPGGSARVSSYIGLFSPANQGYEVEVEGQNLLSPMFNYYDPWGSSSTGGANVTFVQSNPSAVRGLTVSQWSMQSFMTETNLDEIGELQADLQLEGERLVGTVTNRTGQPLRDVILVLRPNYIKLGDLPVGESVAVDLKLELTQDMMYGPSMSWKIYESLLNQPGLGMPQREVEFKRAVLEAVLDQQYYYGSSFMPGQVQTVQGRDELPTVTVLGWMDEAPPKVSINGEAAPEVANALLVSQADFQFPQSGTVNIPVGLLTGVVAEIPFNGGTCGSGTTSIWLTQGEAVLEFIVPSKAIPLQIEKLQFVLQTDSGLVNPPKVEIYHWEDERWQTLDKASYGMNTVFNPAGFVSPERLIRLRLSDINQNFQGGNCQYVAMGLEGTRP